MIFSKPCILIVELEVFSVIAPECYHRLISFVNRDYPKSPLTPARRIYESAIYLLILLCIS